MKAAVVVEPNKVEIQDIGIPEIKGDEVLIKVKTVGVCGSDLHLFKGTHAFRKPPAVLGHEVAGEIIKIGNDVTNFKVGDRVTVEPHIGCGKCEYCIKNLINLCSNKCVPGTESWGGTFADYFNAPQNKVYKIADHISDEIATLIEPLAVGIHAIERISVPERDTIAILGSGTIGLLTLVAAREAGYKHIICTDTQPFNLKMAERHGAALALNPLEEDVAAKILEFTNGRGVDVAIVAADSKVIVDQAASIVRKRGEVGIVAMITQQIPVNTYQFVFNEISLFGAMTYETKDFKKACKLINEGLDISDFITQRLPLNQSQQALDILSEKKENVVKVIVEVNQ
ncbi:alcohol dehydrogenase catalytic domain-containing protein [Siminovitchia sp. FSL H7-0308]|uniref:L-iditol 2-dehydrogenase n=1 Tax=Siminovitchia thermophila TaxID=1245522 RepID=A0ABS2RCT8_9BACI|nr:alcohol dehydrogenase catalytic domain-containing protein [Siminovitchia thermophila]MBM7717468.1 L-iditol 2-dehydrogenase [Siminovitchia thermophila]ONK22321.1 alcohol dehydrogenase [Bacillus sp. VT-16-64]